MVLLLIAYQDIRSRKIDVALLVFLFLAIIGHFWIHQHISYIDIGLNLTFIAINFLAIWCHVSFKNGSMVNPINSYLGLGDFIFWLVIIPLFEFRQFVTIFLLSLIFALGSHLILTRLSMYNSNHHSIPLAGLQGIFILFMLIVNHITSLN